MENLIEPEDGDAKTGEDAKKEEGIISRARRRYAKVPLQIAHTLSDWMKLVQGSGSTLRSGGALRRISVSELREHDSKGDCWVSLYGRVYNVTPYLDYHPGGAQILAEEGGKDVTKLFEENHAWVNFDRLLHACMIGVLCDE